MKRALIAVAAALIAFAAAAATRCDSCARDVHGRIVRSESAKTAFRREHPCPATNHARGACPGWVIDHVIPLKRGGADAPFNMQWQTIPDAKAKDRIE